MALYIKKPVNSLGKDLQDKRWCMKFAEKDAELEGLKPDSKEYKAYVKKRVDELFQIHCVEVDEK